MINNASIITTGITITLRVRIGITKIDTTTKEATRTGMAIKTGMVIKTGMAIKTGTTLKTGIIKIGTTTKAIIITKTGTIKIAITPRTGIIKIDTTTKAGIIAKTDTIKIETARIDTTDQLMDSNQHMGNNRNMDKEAITTPDLDLDLDLDLEVTTTVAKNFVIGGVSRIFSLQPRQLINLLLDKDEMNNTKFHSVIQWFSGV